MSRTLRMRGQFESTTRRDTYGAMYKVCAFCGEEKPIADFPKNGVDSLGHTRYRDDCKTCYNIRRRENRTKKKHTDFIGSQKRRGEDNPDFTHQEWKECLMNKFIETIKEIFSIFFINSIGKFTSMTIYERILLIVIIIIS